jgi:hypothetical protein
MTEFLNKQWNKQYERLVEFKRNHGHCVVPFRYEEDLSFWKWVDNQRTAQTNKKLRADRKELLEKLDFVWRVDKSVPWNKQYEKLVAFQRKNGNCLVPTQYPEDTPFGSWVASQRRYHGNNKIRPGQKELLDKIGFVWKATGVVANYKNNEKNWQQQYEQLVEFKRKNGHCLVPSKYQQEDMSLGSWVSKQRAAQTNNIMRHDRKTLLDKIGFVWKVDKSAPAANAPTAMDQQWNKQYEKLVEFKQKNGNCLVPIRKHQEELFLGNWVGKQRGRHAKNKMRQDRKELLDEIGFVWRVEKYAPWEKQYGKLVEFKQKNGHCRVPKRYQKDLSLGKWVSWQRVNHGKNKLRVDRKELLDEIGFVWKADTLAARSSTTDVSCRRCMVHFTLLYTGPFSHSRCFSA